MLKKFLHGALMCALTLLAAAFLYWLLIKTGISFEGFDNNCLCFPEYPEYLKGDSK